LGTGSQFCEPSSSFFGLSVGGTFVQAGSVNGAAGCTCPGAAALLVLLLLLMLVVLLLLSDGGRFGVADSSTSGARTASDCVRVRSTSPWCRAPRRLTSCACVVAS
jgi:hypothetical protein